MRQLHNKNITNYLKNSIYNYDISKKITYCILQPLIKIRNIKNYFSPLYQTLKHPYVYHLEYAA